MPNAAAAPTARIRPVLLSGGSGTRLWPLSRRGLPKQFLPLLGDETLFEATLARVADRALFLPPMVVCGESHVHFVVEGLARVGVRDAKIVVEPIARNSAPAVGLAAATATSPEYQLVLPCDHFIADQDAFVVAVREGLAAAVDGALVTFGIKPQEPDTGYGYIAAAPGIGPRPVERFVEKPDRAGAEQMIAAGGHYWNAGIFLWRSDALLRELGACSPDVHAAVLTAAAAAASVELDIVRPPLSDFARSPSISVDYAVMEKTSRAIIVPVTMGWSDVGTWASLHALAPHDGRANVIDGHAQVVDCDGCYIRSTGLRVVALGVQDLIVVISDDVAMILPRSHSQRVGEAAAAIIGPTTI